MSPGAWITMSVSVGTVLLLVTFCLYRVVTLPPVDVEEHLKGMPDIDTRDMADAD